MTINAHKLCKKGTLHWCFVYHLCPNDRVAAYHEKCSLESKKNPLIILNQSNNFMQFCHPPWHTLCTVVLTSRRARQRVFPLYYLRSLMFALVLSTLEKSFASSVLEPRFTGVAAWIGTRFGGKFEYTFQHETH